MQKDDRSTVLIQVYPNILNDAKLFDALIHFGLQNNRRYQVFQWLETIDGPASAEHYLNALESRRFFAATGQRATFLRFTGENGIALVEKMTETIALVEQELLDHQ